MGIAASSNSGSASGGQGLTSATSSGDVIRRCHCYSMNYLSLDRRCYRHSLTFNHSGDKTAINPKQKKKRSYGFATFKKKLIGKRRHCKGSDHGRCFREHFIDCSSDILKSLLGQYEAMTLVKDLSVQADLARAPAQTLGQNLAELFDAQKCCDITLVYHGHRIPGHKSILMARCPYFSRHLAFHKSDEFHVRQRTGCVVPPEVLKSVLKYLYTGNADLLNMGCHAEAMAMLEDEFGIPNSLESDIAFLLETLSLGDLRLVFVGDHSVEYLCHRTIVAARSAFLCGVIGKKAKQATTDIMEIRLDGEVIPSRYAKILIHAIYLDSLDLRLIEAVNNLETEDQQSQVVDIMNLYEIGRFLEFNFLSQSCEDLLMQTLNTSNVVGILNWSLKPHGSSWIARQAYQFLEEEFFNIANNIEVLGNLSHDTMLRVLRSDFTQASESEVLQALIKWGEFQLNLKHLDLSPNNTATLGRQGKNSSKRREICDSELKDLIMDLITCVRVPHVLQRDRTSEVLDMALQRNLFSVLPNFTSQTHLATKYSPWDPKCNNGLYVRPRLFLPYFEECKKLIQDRCAQDPEIISSNSPCVSVPDTLYMLRSRHKTSDYSSSAENLLEFQAPRVPDNEVIGKMVERMKKLVNSHSVQRAFCSNFIDANEVMHLVELRVVREFNLPDTYASVLHKARRRSMSTSEFDEATRRPTMMSTRMFFQQRPPQESNLSFLTRPGPDVTLASNAVSTLSLNNTKRGFSPPTSTEQESPDLVGMLEAASGSTAILEDPWKMPDGAASSLDLQSSHSVRRLSHSYCNGPSHMYL